MTVLITGANGMVARATAEHCRSLGDNVAALTREELDISNRDAALSAFERLHPTIVLNCAAYTNVDGAETTVEKCYAANAVGAENLAVASKEFGATLVTISTDYVFDGDRDGFYTEVDEPNPKSVYAKSKYEGELRAQAADSNVIIVRSGWIYGAHGTNFLSMIPGLLRKGKAITAIADSFGTPTYAGDLARQLRELAERKVSGVFHVANSGDGASFFEFASLAAQIGGFDPELIEEVSHKSLDRPAARPVNSRLGSVRTAELGFTPMRDWRDALSAYLISVH